MNWFHRRGDEERRGDTPPGRIRASAHSGVSLVELMIAMLILTLVCVAWLQIIGIQSARKEARRREAVERLVGMMDAFMYMNRGVNPSVGAYYMSRTGAQTITFHSDSGTDIVHSMFDQDISPIGYQLRVIDSEILPDQTRVGTGWGSRRKWLVGMLYGSSGSVEESGKPFFTLPVYMLGYPAK